MLITPRPKSFVLQRTVTNCSAPTLFCLLHLTGTAVMVLLYTLKTTGGECNEWNLLITSYIIIIIIYIVGVALLRIFFCKDMEYNNNNQFSLQQFYLCAYIIYIRGANLYINALQLYNQNTCQKSWQKKAVYIINYTKANSASAQTNAFYII